MYSDIYRVVAQEKGNCALLSALGCLTCQTKTSNLVLNKNHPLGGFVNSFFCFRDGNNLFSKYPFSDQDLPHHTLDLFISLDFRTRFLINKKTYPKTFPTH